MSEVFGSRGGGRTGGGKVDEIFYDAFYGQTQSDMPASGARAKLSYVRESVLLPGGVGEGGGLLCAACMGARARVLNL